MIETERLQFRKYTLDDLDFYASMLADPVFNSFDKCNFPDQIYHP